MNCRQDLRFTLRMETNPPRDIHTFTSSIPNYHSWVEKRYVV